MAQAAYDIRLDLNRDSTFSADLTPYVKRIMWTNGMRASYEEVAPPARLELTLDNRGGVFWPDGAGAFSNIAPGTRVRIRASFGAITNQTLYLGKLVELRPVPGVRGSREALLVCDDSSPLLYGADYLPPLQLDATVDEALTALFDAGLIALPYDRAFWLLGMAGASELGTTSLLFDSTSFTTLDAGKTRLAYVGDPLRPVEQNAGGFVRDLVAAEGGGRLFYDARSGRYVFHNRHRDALNETIFATLSAGDLERAEDRYGDDVATRVTVRYRPRRVGSAGTVLWSADNLPLRLVPRQTREIVARYRDPDQPQALIGALDPVPPVAYVDYAASELANGAGRDLTAKISVSAAFRAGGAVLTLRNDGRFEAFVSELQIRGKPLYAYDHQAASAASPEARRDADERPLLLDAPALSDDEDAATYAHYVLTRFQTALNRFASVDFVANKSAARLERALTAGIGSRVRVSEGESGHSADYLIVGERHTVVAGGEHTHEVTWVLKPAERESLWILGTAGRSELGTTSRLAY